MLDIDPLWLMLIAIVTIAILILRLRVNAFLALIAAALLVGLLSPKVLVVPVKDRQGNVLKNEQGEERQEYAYLEAPKKVGEAFGSLMGRIGIVIALATIIGKALMDSGGADRIVRAFSRLFGEANASYALLLSGFILSIPVFFDTVFFLLVPLAKALRLRSGANFLLYVMAIGAGGAVTHSLVPPTPGPIAMSSDLKVDLGTTILVGILIGAPIALTGYLYGSFVNRRWPVPLRAVGNVTLEEMEQSAQRPDEELPSLFVSFLPIVLPVILITSNTIFGTLSAANPGLNQPWLINGIEVSPGSLLAFVGDPSMALLLSAVVAMWMVARQKGLTLVDLGRFTGLALDEAGMILLVTSAGGALGAMLRHAGVDDSLRILSQKYDLSLLFLGWAVAVVFKIAQGSGTVSMTTTAGIMAGILNASIGLDPQAVARLDLAEAGARYADYLGYHPVYLVMAIGAGSLVGSWMNDSGFWVVCKMSGMTENETLRSWTLCLVVMGLAGLPIIWLLSVVLPLT